MANIIKTVENSIEHWWTFLAAGVLLILMGVAVYIYPILFFSSLSWIIGGFIGVEGIIHIMFAVANRKKLHSWVWVFTIGMAELFLGSILFFYPGMTIITIPLIVGLWLIIRGFSLINYSVELRKRKAANWGLFLTGGIMTIIFAAVIMYDPLIGALFLVVWAGIGFFIAGIFNILLALHFRKFNNEIEPDVIVMEETVKKVL